MCVCVCVAVGVWISETAEKGEIHIGKKYQVDLPFIYHTPTPTPTPTHTPTVTYGAVVNACAYARDMAGARRVMEEMRADGVMPDAVEYSLLLHGYKRCVF